MQSTRTNTTIRKNDINNLSFIIARNDSELTKELEFSLSK